MDSVMRHICLNYLEDYKVSQEFREFFRDFTTIIRKCKKVFPASRKNFLIRLWSFATKWIPNRELHTSSTGLS